jgi:hypothetical protein
MKDDALKIETDSLLDVQQLINNDSNNAQQRHKLEPKQIKRLYSASTVMSLDTT